MGSHRWPFESQTGYVVGSTSVKAEDLFGQLSLEGLQLRQQTDVENPRLGPIQKARTDAVIDYVHRGERIELAVEDTATSGKESSSSFLSVVT